MRNGVAAGIGRARMLLSIAAVFVLLPNQRSDYYREYTVPTQGERDRGPRRIVAGQSGERYYTADHYRSLREVVR